MHKGQGESLDAIAKLFNKILQDPEKMGRSIWTDFRAVLLEKESVGDIKKYRPLGIGEAWYRLFAKALMMQVGADVGGLLKPLQLERAQNISLR